MKKSTMKSLGIPKGFRLTGITRKWIIQAAGEETFSKRANKLAKEEHKLFKEVVEALYPQDKLREFEEAIEQAYELFPTVSLKKEDYIREKNEINVRFGNSQTVQLGEGYSGRTLTEKDVGFVTLPADELKFSCFVPVGEGEGYAYYTYVSSELLPAGLQKKILNFSKRRDDLRAKTQEFREKMAQILWGYSSVISLCETFPEFVPWIVKAANSDKEEKPSCSDIPLADTMQEIKKLTE